MKEPLPLPQAAPTTSVEQEVEAVLAAFRAATGLSLCVKLLPGRGGPASGIEPVVARHNLHQEPFCLTVKQTRNEQCRQCDLRDVPERCERERDLFAHVCHAGAGEVIVPLFVREVLAGLVYIGQYRSGADQPEELPLLSPGQLAHVMSLARLLRAYLTERLRTPRFVSESSRGFRSDAIHRFLEKELRSNPTLGDLADHLGLSVARTAHAVREATGASFVTLRDAMRLERACGLLQGTYHKVAHVARESGFDSPQYFHRFFRKKMGMTPQTFRRRHRAEV